MPIQPDPKKTVQVKATVARRLRAARAACGLSQLQAADALGHKGATQISLAEDGKRVPPISDLFKLADLYCVSLDFLVGRIDDPIAEAEEHQSGLVARAVANSIAECVETFTKAVSEHVAIVLSGHREDRVDLQKAIKIGDDLKFAINRLRELNPGYDELKGASRIETAAVALSDIGDKLKVRIHREKSQRAAIDNVIRLDKIEASIKQFSLDFTVITDAQSAPH